MNDHSRDEKIDQASPSSQIIRAFPESEAKVEWYKIRKGFGESLSFQQSALKLAMWAWARNPGEILKPKTAAESDLLGHPRITELEDQNVRLLEELEILKSRFDYISKRLEQAEQAYENRCSRFSEVQRELETATAQLKNQSKRHTFFSRRGSRP